MQSDLPINRRGFLAGLALSGAGTLTALRGSFAQTAPRPFRTVTYNILGAQGYAPSRAAHDRLEKQQARIPHLIAAQLSSYKPQIITFQEAPAENVIAEMASELEMDYAYFPGGYSGALLSIFPIVSSANCPLAEGPRPLQLFTRHWGRANLDIEGRLLTVYSIHLHPIQQAIRIREIDAALAAIASGTSSNETFLIQGDFNHKPDTPEHQKWIEAGFKDSFADRGKGPPKTNPSFRPRQRIDYIWASPSMAKRLKVCRVLAEGPFARNPKDSGAFLLSDHLPVMADF